MDIANALKSLRLASGLTQKELSNRLDIAQATIACYETGQRIPNISSLIAYANFFDCSLDYITERCDEFGNHLTPLPTHNTHILSDEERDFLIKFQSLTKGQRAILKGYIDGLKAQNA